MLIPLPIGGNVVTTPLVLYSKQELRSSVVRVLCPVDPTRAVARRGYSESKIFFPNPRNQNKLMIKPVIIIIMNA